MCDSFFFYAPLIYVFTYSWLLMCYVTERGAFDVKGVWSYRGEPQNYGALGPRLLGKGCVLPPKTSPLYVVPRQIW